METFEYRGEGWGEKDGFLILSVDKLNEQGDLSAIRTPCGAGWVGFTKVGTRVVTNLGNKLTIVRRLRTDVATLILWLRDEQGRLWRSDAPGHLHLVEGSSADDAAAEVFSWSN